MEYPQGGYTLPPPAGTGPLCGCPILYGFWGRYRQLSNCQRPSMNVQVRGFIALAGAFGSSSIDTTWAWTNKRNTHGDKPGVLRAGRFW